MASGFAIGRMLQSVSEGLNCKKFQASINMLRFTRFIVRILIVHSVRSVIDLTSEPDLEPDNRESELYMRTKHVHQSSRPRGYKSLQIDSMPFYLY